ncbi:translation initiation factor IF-3 [Chloroflexota bacterium]
MNERIRTKEIRLVGDKGEQLGVMPVEQALDMAKKRGYDLVEVAPTATPPVCRILDYGRYKYQQEKKERDIRKSQKVSELREIRMRPKIGEHDFQAKVRSVKKLLGEGDKVKLAIIFRGREITHSDLGWVLLKKVVESVKGEASIEKQPTMEGYRMFIILAPLTAQQIKAKEEANKEEVKEGVKSS